MSKPAEIPAFVSGLPAEFAAIDVLINNAGMVHGVERVGEIAKATLKLCLIPTSWDLLR